jgi:hypothetical protein
VVTNTGSLPLTITLANNGNESLIVTAVTMSGDYSETDNCGTLPATLTAGSTCVFIITFTPTQLGARPGSLTINDNAATPSQTVTFTGTGVSSAGSGRRLHSGVNRDRLRRATIIIRR